MRLWMWMVVGLLTQTGCYLWATPPLEARVGVGPARAGRSSEPRTLFNGQLSMPFTFPSRDTAYDVRIGYLLQPIPGEGLVHGPLVGTGYSWRLLPVDVPPEIKLLAKHKGRSIDDDDYSALADGARIFQIGTHLQARGLFGQGVGVEAAAQVSLDFGVHDDIADSNILEHAKAPYVLVVSGYRTISLYVEASAGVQDARPRWGMCVGLAFRVPATFGAGISSIITGR